MIGPVTSQPLLEALQGISEAELYKIVEQSKLSTCHHEPAPTTFFIFVFMGVHNCSKGYQHISGDWNFPRSFLNCVISSEGIRCRF